MITSQQREERRLGIGGSDMPIIMGFSEYKTPYQLYLEKIGQGKSSDNQNELQYWGSQLEGVIRDEFAKRHNVSVETPDTLIHPDYPFLRGNIDGFVPAYNAVLEVKCSSAYRASDWGEDGSDNIPMPYLVQVAHYCTISNADCAYIAVLIGGNEYREYKYERNIEFENHIIGYAKRFWDCVQNKTPPNPEEIIDLRLLFPKQHPGKVKSINSDIEMKISSLFDTRLQIKKLSDMEDQYKFHIMQFMEDAECLVNQSGQPIITWKANKRGSRTFLMKGVN
jgi:putative phage-type endonuclease